MLKKFIANTILLLSLVMLPSFVVSQQAFAQTGTPPGEALDEGGFTFDLTSVTHENLEGQTRQRWIRGGIGYFIERTITVMAGVIGTLSVLMLTVGGFLMLSSAGSEDQYNRGKNYAKYSLIGLAVTLSAYVLVTLVQLLISSIYG